MADEKAKFRLTARRSVFIWVRTEFVGAFDTGRQCSVTLALVEATLNLSFPSQPTRHRNHE